MWLFKGPLNECGIYRSCYILRFTGPIPVGQRTTVPVFLSDKEASIRDNDDGDDAAR